MTAPGNPQRQLSRMEEARRQTQRQQDLVERQITRRMTALIPGLLPRRTHYRRGKAPDRDAYLERYRTQLAVLTAERQPEIDALARKLARQEQAISKFRSCEAEPSMGASRRSDAAAGATVDAADDVLGGKRASRTHKWWP